MSPPAMMLSALPINVAGDTPAQNVSMVPVPASDGQGQTPAGSFGRALEDQIKTFNKESQPLVYKDFVVPDSAPVMAGPAAEPNRLTATDGRAGLASPDATLAPGPSWAGPGTGLVGSPGGEALANGVAPESPGVRGKGLPERDQVLPRGLLEPAESGAGTDTAMLGQRVDASGRWYADSALCAEGVLPSTPPSTDAAWGDAESGDSDERPLSSPEAWIYGDSAGFAPGLGAMAAAGAEVPALTGAGVAGAAAAVQAQPSLAGVRASQLALGVRAAFAPGPQGVGGPQAGNAPGGLGANPLADGGSGPLARTGLTLTGEPVASAAPLASTTPVGGARAQPFRAGVAGVAPTPVSGLPPDSVNPSGIAPPFGSARSTPSGTVAAEGAASMVAPAATATAAASGADANARFVTGSQNPSPGEPTVGNVASGRLASGSPVGRQGGDRWVGSGEAAVARDADGAPRRSAEPALPFAAPSSGAGLVTERRSTVPRSGAGEFAGRAGPPVLTGAAAPLRASGAEGPSMAAPVPVVVVSPVVMATPAVVAPAGNAAGVTGERALPLLASSHAGGDRTARPAPAPVPTEAAAASAAGSTAEALPAASGADGAATLRAAGARAKEGPDDTPQGRPNDSAAADRLAPVQTAAPGQAANNRPADRFDTAPSVSSVVRQDPGAGNAAPVMDTAAGPLLQMLSMARDIAGQQDTGLSELDGLLPLSGSELAATAAGERGPAVAPSLPPAAALTRADAAAAASVPGQPLSVGRGAQGWGEELSARIQWVAGRHMTFADIQIDPPELGPIQVQVQTHRDGASVQFTTHNAAVRDLVEQSLPRLREMLEGSGMNLVDVNVAQQGDGRRGQRETGFATAAGGATAEIELAAPDAGRAPPRLGLVDDYA